jgi:hypothetical protein
MFLQFTFLAGSFVTHPSFASLLQIFGFINRLLMINNTNVVFHNNDCDFLSVSSQFVVRASVRVWSMMLCSVEKAMVRKKV